MNQAVCNQCTEQHTASQPILIKFTRQCDLTKGMSQTPITRVYERTFSLLLSLSTLTEHVQFKTEFIWCLELQLGFVHLVN